MTKKEQLLKASDLMQILEISRSRSYRLINSGCFPTLRVGNNIYVTRTSLNNWLYGNSVLRGECND